MLHPGQVAPLVGVSFDTPKGCMFNPLWDHIQEAIN